MTLYIFIALFALKVGADLCVGERDCKGAADSIVKGEGGRDREREDPVTGRRLRRFHT